MNTPDYERARSALAFISPDDRDTWLRMGMAIKDGFGDEGFDLWDAWSRQSDRYVERDARDVWKSIKRGGGITLATLFHEAKANGWRDDGPRPTPEDPEARRKRNAKEKAEERAQHEAAAARAAEIWQAASPWADSHAYLIRKVVKAYGVRVHDGSLVVPVRDGTQLHSLQFIAPDGSKKFLNGGPVSGCYFSIGDVNGAGPLCICEGFATGASIHEATGYPVVVAFFDGNLLPVAKAMRARFPDMRLILCADDDARTPGNPGLTKATAAARAVGGTTAVPGFGENRPEDATDFNDLHRHAGLEAVRGAIEPGGDELPPVEAYAEEDAGLEAAFGEDRLAAEFTKVHGEDWRYVDAWGKWMLWTYSRWIVEGTRAALHLVRLICRAAADSATQVALANKIASRSTVSGAECLARSDRRHAMTVGDWDRDPYLLNTLKGTVDLRTSELREHRREDYITKITAATPQGECPRWMAFLDDITARDLEYQGYLRRMAGYMLTGDTSEHAMFFSHGTGGNGKSVFAGVLSAVLGDYATTAPMDTFMETKSDRHPTDLAGLRGADTTRKRL